MTWKNERTIHIDGEEWAWVLADSGVLVRSPSGTVSLLRFKDLGLEVPESEYDGSRQAVTPGVVKNVVLKHVKDPPVPEHERYHIIGDVHGCFSELMDLMDKLGHKWEKSKGIHRLKACAKIVFVGDIVDRGPRSVTTLMYVRNMVSAGRALWTIGNHDDKLMRWAKGNKVTLNHGLSKTVHDFESDGLSKLKLFDFMKSLPMYLVLDHGRLVVSHGGWYEGIGRAEKGKIRSWCLYGPTTGEMLENGLPERIDWAGKRLSIGVSSPFIVYGHQPHTRPRLVNKTACIDTGCCFGGHLTALRWPEMEMVQVPALSVWDREGRELNGFSEREKDE